MLYVAVLYGWIIVGDQTLQVSLEFKNITACNVARIALEAKHAGAKLSCVDGAVHMFALGGAVWNPSVLP